MKIGIRCSEGNGNFNEALQEVEFAEQRGFDSVWLSEHHGMGGHWPSPQVALAAFATKTESIYLGTSVILLPQCNPVRLAGEVNLLDQISNGRFILGVGAGWRKPEMENLGWSFHDRGRRMTEFLRALQELWHETSSDFVGEYVQFDRFRVEPDPIQTPHPPVWVGGSATPALKRAAKLGDAWFPVWKWSISELREKYGTYQSFRDGKADDQKHDNRPLLRFFWVDEDRDIARERLQGILQRQCERADGDGNWFSEHQSRIENDFDAFARDRFVYGTPEECANQINTLEDELDIDHVILRIFSPGVDHSSVMHQIDLAGQRMLPLLR